MERTDAEILKQASHKDAGSLPELLLIAATDADATVLVNIIRAAFAEYQGLLNPPSGALKESVEEIRESMRTARYVLALVGKDAVGCVMYEERGEYLYLGRLAVLPPWRGRGIARALLDYVEGRADEMGITSVRLGVRVALSDLREMYERHGYRIIAYQSNEGHSEPTYVILQKVLEGGTKREN